VFSAKGTRLGRSMIGMIFFRNPSAWVYSFSTQSEIAEFGDITTITY
jgi:hypothetical protein